MNDTFEVRLRASARAGWWTLLIGVAFLLIMWIIYLLMTSARPSWPLVFWGSGVSWDTVQPVWFWGAAAFKFCLWIMALVVIWMTLWARQLRRGAGKS
jgi:hypothetical protein